MAELSVVDIELIEMTGCNTAKFSYETNTYCDENVLWTHFGFRFGQPNVYSFIIPQTYFTIFGLDETYCQTKNANQNQFL